MTSTTYSLDQTHVGIRLVVLVTMVAGLALGSWLIMPVVSETLGLGGPSQFCAAVTGGILIGLGGGWIMEQILRRVWPSRHWLEVNSESITLHDRSGDKIDLRWADRINVLSWHFVIREGRAWVPRGWFCVACRLTQDDRAFTPYALFKPAEAEKLPQWSAFERLLSRKHAPKRGEDHHLKQIGEQGQIRAAEKDRWMDGVEMSAQDFNALIAELDKRLEGWPPAVQE